MPDAKPKRHPLPKRREIDLRSHDYQPSKKELEEDVRVNATFDEAVDALKRPVRIRYIDRPKPV